MSATAPSHKPHILLTGGTGLIGSKLTNLLLEKGYTVSQLNRRKTKLSGVKNFLWNVEQGEIDAKCLEGVDIIIHLAGEGIAEKRWTEERKRAITASRTQSIRLIYDLMKRKAHQVKRVISASAIGYYSDRGNELMTEDSAPNRDFMARCCVDWEAAVDEGKALGLQITEFRTGVVLSDSGALAKMAAPIKWFVGAPLGSGRQWVPWIHLDDVVNMYLFAAEHPELEGVFNQVAPNPVTNQQITKALGKQLRRPVWPLHVPAALLKVLMGEMSTIVLGSTKVSAQKIENAGFHFKYPCLQGALEEIYG